MKSTLLLCPRRLYDLAPGHLTELISHHHPPHSLSPSRFSLLSVFHLNTPLTCFSSCPEDFSSKSSQDSLSSFRAQLIHYLLQDHFMTTSVKVGCTAAHSLFYVTLFCFFHNTYWFLKLTYLLYILHLSFPRKVEKLCVLTAVFLTPRKVPSTE